VGQVRFQCFFKDDPPRYSTFGGNFASYGRIQGIESIQTVNCNPNCQIKVHASSPSFALVFLAPQAPETFPMNDAFQNTATVDSAVLATGNGCKGLGNERGGTSRGSVTLYLM
jgi:hypothetical protein